MARYRRSKYGNHRVQVDGIWFDSKREAEWYGKLKLLKRANEIRDLKIHPAFPIIIHEQRVCKVILDFTYVDAGRTCIATRHYVDIKGKDNPLSRLKRKLVEAQYGIKVEVIK